jgi:hypothetical protein
VRREPQTRPEFLQLSVAATGPRLAHANGGADRDRTDDLKLAKLALSQLSYGPGFDDAADGGPGTS